MPRLQLRVVGATVRRAATARAPPRRFFSAVSCPSPSPMTDSQTRLLRRLSEVEAANIRKAQMIEVEHCKLRVALRGALSLFSESTAKASEAVRETAKISVIFLSGVVVAALGGVYLAKPKKTAAMTALESTKAAAASAGAAAESAAASASAAHASIMALDKKLSDFEKKP